MEVSRPPRQPEVANLTRPPRLGMRLCRSLTRWALSQGYLESDGNELTPKGKRLLDDRPE